MRLIFLSASVAAVAMYRALVDAVRLRGSAPPKREDWDDEDDDAEAFVRELEGIRNCSSENTYGCWERPS